MNIVLHNPKIPYNTGNIGRTCVSTGSTLHLIKPLGFDVDDKAIKRAGMDYWYDVDVRYYDDFEQFNEINCKPKIYMCTTKAQKTYCEFKYNDNDFFMFGSESFGIPEEILLDYKETCIRIPMLDKYRSLNLCNSVAIILYEGLRQNNFSEMKLTGNLHKNSW